MRAVFVDANPTLAAIADALHRPNDPALTVVRRPDIKPEELPEAIGDGVIAWIDHTYLPTPIARKCRNLRHVVFLGTGARSYMNPEELAELGISVHIIKGYGDTAVAECTMALMWSAAKGIARMDGAMRQGEWLRTDGLQLTGKTIGLIGYGGIAAEVARMAGGMGMKVLAWNRTQKSAPGVSFVGLDDLLAKSDVVSMHLLLNDETKGFLSRDRIAKMKKGALLINTARGALVDEAAMIEALKSGQIGHAGLDVFVVEPVAPGHALLGLPNVTLSAHSAFRTREASENLIEAALGHSRRIATGG